MNLNPISYWRFEESIGATVAADETNSFPGTYQGVDLEQPGPPGMGGNSVHFDGIDIFGGDIIVSL